MVSRDEEEEKGREAMVRVRAPAAALTDERFRGTRVASISVVAVGGVCKSWQEF